MPQGEQASDDYASIALKILYTLHGTDSQRYIVKPSRPVTARLFRDLELGVVDIQVCLNAIRKVSPDFSLICDTHCDEYAVYSTDYAEEGLPLQSHGKVSQQDMTEATGKLCTSKLNREQLELLIHLLPVRKPQDRINDFYKKEKTESFNDSGSSAGEQSHNQNHKNLLSFPLPPPSFMNSNMLPPLPPQVQIPSSLASGPTMRSEAGLPSSPPVRAKPITINPSVMSSSLTYQDASDSSESLSTGAPKRAFPESSSGKKRKALSPKAEGEAQCGNCGVATASTWRRARCPDGKGELLCNACGLYYRAKKVMRPRFLWDKMRSRSDQESMLSNNAEPLVSANPELSSSSGIMQSQQSMLGPHNNSMHNNGIHNNSMHNNGMHTNSMHTNSMSSMHTSSIRIENPPTPQDMPQMLWSRDQTNTFLASDPAELSDRLVDHPDQLGKGQHTAAQIAKSDEEGAKPPRNTETDQVPSTPERKTTFAPLEPDSMQKWLGLSTPDQRMGFLIPGSGSARKWLDRALNPSNFDEVWNSPTPRKTRSAIPDLAMFTSSPPTSSNMLSEVAEWNLANGSPGTPQTLKFLRGTDSEPEPSLKPLPEAEKTAKISNDAPNDGAKSSTYRTSMKKHP